MRGNGVQAGPAVGELASVSETAPSSRARGARKAIGGGLWTVAERGISQASQLIIFIAAARILTPAEFGVFALVSACAILLLRVAEVGWAQYIMAWNGDTTVPRQVLFVAIIAGALMGAAGGLAGMAMPLVGIDPDVGHLIALFSVWVVLAATSAAQKGVMIWQDRLKASARCEIVGEMAGLSVALAALYSGFGVFALVFGRLTFQSVHLIASFIVTRMGPLSGLRGTQLRELLVFSGQIFSGRMIINLRLYAGTFIIGGFLGPAAVGYYRAAERLVGAVAEILGVPTQVLAWSLFRQARDDGDGTTARFQEQAVVFFKILMAIALPIFIWIAIMAEEIITSLLGAQWLPALPVVAILAFSRAIMLPGFATEPILSLAGEIRRLPGFAILFLTLTVVFALATAPHGLLAVAWGQVGVAIVIAGATFWMFQRYAAIEWRALIAGASCIAIPILIGTGTLFAIADVGVFAELAPLAEAIATALAASVIYVLALLAADRQLRAFLMRQITRLRATP